MLRGRLRGGSGWTGIIVGEWGANNRIRLRRGQSQYRFREQTEGSGRMNGRGTQTFRSLRRAPFGLALLLTGRPPGDVATPAKPGESCEKRESQPGDEQKCRRGANLGAVEDRGRGERDSREDAEVAERLHQHAAETQARASPGLCGRGV